MKSLMHSTQFDFREVDDYFASEPNHPKTSEVLKIRAKLSEAVQLYNEKNLQLSLVLYKKNEARERKLKEIAEEGVNARRIARQKRKLLSIENNKTKKKTN